MKIWINSNALTSGRSDLLRSGCLFGLKKLQEWNHQVGYDSDSLTERQNELLENEKINPDFPDQSDSDALISCQSGNKSVLQFIHSEKVESESKHWIDLVKRICLPERSVELDRKSSETQISLKLTLDGSGQSDIDTGIGFFDHMLEQVAKHGFIDLELTCNGDLEVDEHHTIEDVAIVLGKAIDRALGEKRGIERYGFVLPMDESQARIALDLSGRPYLKFNGSFAREKVGGFPTEMVEHFFYSLAMNLKATLHISVDGENDHHKIEACYKGFARCLREAVSRNEQNIHVLPSTKDLL